MPQFDPSTFAPQLVWLVITFGVLYFAMARFALPRVTAALEGRKRRVTGDLASAEAMRRESEELERAYQARLAAARAEAAALLKAERAKIEARLNERAIVFAAETDGRMAEAERRIAAAKAKGLAEALRVSGEIAAAVVTRLAGEDARIGG